MEMRCSTNVLKLMWRLAGAAFNDRVLTLPGRPSLPAGERDREAEGSPLGSMRLAPSGLSFPCADAIRTIWESDLVCGRLGLGLPARLPVSVGEPKSIPTASNAGLPTGAGIEL